MQVVVVVPAWNEEQHLAGVLQDLRCAGFDRVVVVDDGSTDASSAIATQHGAVVARHAINRGQGAALQTGNQVALAWGADVVVHFDADQQFVATDILAGVRMLQQENIDIVFGSRFLDDRTTLPFFKRSVILPIARLMNWLFTGVLLTDVHNGFRVLSRSAVERLQITEDRMAHNSEIVALARKYNLAFHEVPVMVVYHEFGQGIGGGIKIIKDLFTRFFLA